MLTNKQLYGLAKKWKLHLKFAGFSDECRYDNGFYILNLGDRQNKHTREGTHWTALWCTPREWVYFDSFAGVPPLPVQAQAKNVVLYYNQTQVQSLRQEMCGLYALYFLYYCSRGGDPFKFQDLFSPDLSKNDQVLSDLISQIRQ